ncbi:MAG: GatB/YqeY domain-containing protein [Nitrospinaceae bacterium]|nr:GatB/YqeY domain-containing protein [Nitrospinaceae bacterium]NIR53585.1 GatB/YqeY domain-containing protein [Nitrospinaceae bacterium]NIS83986.1 GatB/YqeY domain-containing protein [Nitrospinaceae bacterium]NIT80795.1 GatB/YqeY domain-containing protein [Nitrospinaceae bacterium]NIU43101.1 GatB/YqeY domain-containing protein [Nitrospinaceae bacterium]
MDLRQALLSDLKGAMKSRDSLKVDTLRLIVSEIKNKEIDLHEEMKDEAITALLTTQIKKRKEAAAMFEKGGRTDLKGKEESEIAILQTYLPEQVGEEELKKRIQELIAETGAQSPKDMGKVMKRVVPEFKGKADGGAIRKLVTELLA